MSLSDPRYFLFLGLIFLLFYTLRVGEPRRWFLLAASYFFYFELSRFYTLVLFFVTLATYFGARLLRSFPAQKHSFTLFALVILIALFPLIVFKYLGVFLDSSLREHFLLLAFPVGISFFTFVALGYLIDVYLEVVDPEPSFSRVALLLAFFPLISAGPIERAGRFIPQFDLAMPFSAERALSALRLIFVGLILKMVFASNLQTPVDAIFANPTSFPPLEKLFGVIYYAFCLYSDFAGYSLIAIGSAKLFGLEVRPNFQQPFLSATVPEFWRNWHISLSSWVRDYLFSPLRMEWRRLGNFGMTAALLLSFVILGVWHGAHLKFLVFGLMHGLLVVGSSYTLARRDAFWKSLRVPPMAVYVVRTFITFFLVLMTFVVFRASDMNEAMVFYKAIFSFGLLQNISQSLGHLVFQQGPALYLGILHQSIFWVLIALLIAGDILVRKKITLETLPGFFQVIICYVGIVVIAYHWITENVTAPFQYYKF